MNRYQILNQIGRGGQGTVYLAIDTQKGVTVALKRVPLNEQTKAFANQEISALRTISGNKCSPYIVCYLDSFIDPIANEVIIVMNYIDGPTVLEYTQPLRMINDQKTLALAGKALLKAMLLGLQTIHSKGIIHNDIKPSNIVVGPTRTPVLADFGISCVTQQAVDSVCTAVYGKVIDDCCQNGAGTAIYLPPEAIKKVRYPESDLWSLGATIYTIVTGSNIWGLNIGSYDAYKLMNDVISKMIQGIPPNKLNSVDPTLNTIVNGFLVYDPSVRMKLDQALAML